MKKNSPITIAHIHVWDKNNKGDVAIVLAVQELLRQKFLSCKILDFPVETLKSGTETDLQKINSADFVIIGGGGIFYSYFLPYCIDFIRRITKPIIIFGAGYIKEVGAPELSSAARVSLVELIKAATLVGVRDYKTKEFLESHGAPLRKIKVIGDPAVLLIEKKPARFKISPRTKKIASKQLPIRLGLNLNYSGWLGFGEWREDILNSYRAVADYFIDEYSKTGEEKATSRSTKPGLEIYYLKHHPGEDNIYPELKIKDLKVVDLKAAEQKYIYGQMDLVIGMMLHAGVLAFGAGTPEISVAYDLRNYSFAEFIKCPELVIDLNKLKNGELLKRVKQVFTKRQKYVNIFRHKKAEIYKKQNEFLDRVKKSVY